MQSIVSITVLLGLVAFQVTAEPESAPEPGPQAPQPYTGTDAALGRPNPNAGVDPTTQDNPGYVDTNNQAAADAVYGPSTRTVGPDGREVSGYTPYDSGVSYEPGDYTTTTPEYHTVQKGDTLWGVSGYYLRDPYLWPKLWSYNDHVTNAHWIFPGDQLRLTDPYGRGDGDGDGSGSGSGQLGSDDALVKYTKPRMPVTQDKNVYVMNQTNFVDAEEFESAMEVVGGDEAKVMMGTLDKIYIEYDRDQPPVAGERLVIYAPQEPVRDVDSKEVLGYLVEVVGETEIDRVARETAEGTVALATNPVERGYKVGPLRRRFKRITETPAEATEVGRVVATIEAGGPIEGKLMKKRRKRKSTKKRNRAGLKDTIAGEEQFVIMDLGSEDGVKEGNVVEAVRKGDEYSDKHAFKIPYEDGWPRRVVARILVVEVQEKTSIGVVIWSRREVERGEYIEMRGPGMQDEASQDAARISAEAESSARAGNGKASGEARFKMGN